MKKIVCMMMVLCMALSLCGCTDKAVEQMKVDILGTWTAPSYFTTDEASKLLLDFGFYEEEYAFTDITKMQWVDQVTFTADGKYTMEYDAAKTEAEMKAFIDGMISDIYANLDSMEEVYGVTSADFDSEEEFKEAYAVDLYGMDSYDQFLNDMVQDILFDYYDFNNMVYDFGTYKVTSKGIEMTEDGDTTAYLCGAEINGNELTLTFSEGPVTYTKAK